MAHEYSVQIHEFLSGKLKEVEEGMAAAAAANDAEQLHYEKGRLDLLNTMRKHMTDKFDLATQKYF